MQQSKSRLYGGGNGHQFDPDSSAYRCCCNYLSVRGGSMAVGVVHIICAVVAILAMIAAYVTMWERNYGVQLLVSVGSLSVGIIVCIGVIALAIVMILGVRAGAPVLILPFLVAQVFMLIGLLFVFIVSIITVAGTASAVFGPDRYSTSQVFVNDDTLHMTEALSAACTVMSFVGFFVECWFMTVVGGAYRFFAEETKFRG